MADHLARRHGIMVETRASDAVAIDLHDRESGKLVLLDTAPAATRRFQIARLLCAIALSDAIEAELGESDLLTTPVARQRAVRALSSYAAGAMLMPYEPFLEDAIALRYDVGLLAHKHRVSFEQACHRLVTLRRPDAAGIPFAFMRADPAGYVTKRFPLPRLPIPRYGNACPLWAVYSAFQNSGVIVRQLAELPAGDRFLFIARAVVKEQALFGQHPHVVSIMLACDAVHADQTTYADGLDLAAPSLAAPIGPTCRLCPRETCRHREEDPIVGSGRFAG
jgi:predicted transcriptional regulator